MEKNTSAGMPTGRHLLASGAVGAHLPVENLYRFGPHRRFFGLEVREDIDAVLGDVIYSHGWHANVEG